MPSQQQITERVYFTQKDDTLPIPNLIEHQLNSWNELVETGIKEIFAELNPIEDYTKEKLSIRFKDYYFDEPKMTAQMAKDNNATYEATLNAVVELVNKATGEVKDQTIYLGSYPWMTDQASFVVNGIERVIVSQLIRSAGVLFSATESNGKKYFSAKMIPGRGAWLELETASTGEIYVKIDRRRKLPVTTLLRALGYNSNREIKELFKDVKVDQLDYIAKTIEKETSRTTSEALLELFRRLRPGNLATVDNARDMIERMFFDFRHFDYSMVGRYKINQRLNLKTPNDKEHRVFQLKDLVAIIAEVIRLNESQGEPDDMDALSNRRVRLVGELVARQFRIGLLRMQRNIMDRMSVVDIESVTPNQLINPRPIVASVREFFASSQLSQFMDQTNVLSELSHKRRLSSMGPGGLTRERAGFQVRDAHPTHYGRICAVETPEGHSVGLVLNLATYARINKYGFIETPYLKVKNSQVTNEIVYIDAAQEEKETIADAGAELGKNNKFVNQRVSARRHLQAERVDAKEVTLMDTAHRQILGAVAALVPFIEKNRVDRALTGANMQRQAVPLLQPESPIVGTGIEHAIAQNTPQLVTADADGIVKKADADEVVVEYKTGIKTYPLTHFAKTNDNRCTNQRVVVSRGDKVKKDTILIEGASISNGELGLGRDLRVAFMPWNGYNMDDAIILSKRLVQNDSLTSINIKDYIVEVRETKLGPELVTRDIPNVSEESLRNLDEHGIVQVGSEVKAGDILVGKITPKGEQELSSEERLLRAIFGEKAKDVRDTSKRLDNTGNGKVINVKIFSREDGHELKAGVLKQIQIFVAQMRKISVGDKMAGRYGNKGVVAKILAEEDMPYMEDGTPVDIILNPLGVPSRMNLGQLFETHIGIAAQILGYKIATVSYNGVPDEVISQELTKAGLPKNGKVTLYDGQTGEAFKEAVTVGVMHMMKLHHMVSDKIHARSIGPYTKVTQQPLGGKAQNGGQRFGEMEVWALEAYGAATILQEMLTIKSDDVSGRARAYESIIKNEPIIGPKMPESFNVLVKELQGLGLKIDLINTNQENSETDESNYDDQTTAELEPSIIDENQEIEAESEIVDAHPDNQLETELDPLEDNDLEPTQTNSTKEEEIQ